MSSPLVGFSRDVILMEGMITLQVTTRQALKQATVILIFLVVKVPSTYNIILGRSDLNALHAIISTYHLLIKFPAARGVEEVWGNQALAKQCYMATLKGKKPQEALPIDNLDLEDKQDPKRGQLAKELLSVPLDESNPTPRIQIGSRLSEAMHKHFFTFLRSNVDIFAWTTSGLPNVNPEIMVHWLNINPLI